MALIFDNNCVKSSVARWISAIGAKLPVLQETQWAVKKKCYVRYTLAKTKRQSLTSITGINGAYWASCYINVEILPPFASDTRCTGFSFIFRTFSNYSSFARAPFYSIVRFLFFLLINFPVCSCATSVYSLINGTRLEHRTVCAPT